MKTFFKFLHIFAIPTYLFTLLVASEIENGTDFVNLHFIDDVNLSFPASAVRDIFSLPADYHTSTMKSRSSQGLLLNMKTFLVRCRFKEFSLYLVSLYHLHIELGKIHVNILQVTDFNYQEIYNESFTFFHGKKVYLRYFKRLYPILQKCEQEQNLGNWLSAFVMKVKPIDQNQFSFQIVGKWIRSFQYAVPIMFLEDLCFQTRNKNVGLTPNVLAGKWRHRFNVGSGSYGTCYQVGINDSTDCSCSLERLILKVFKEKYTSKHFSKVNFREYFILQKGHFTDTRRYSTIFSIVVSSSQDYSPIGYLMEEFEFGDLTRFLPHNQDVLLSKYFMKELLEVARAIDALNKKGIFHLDIKANNIFVRRKETEDSCDNYELVIGDFGLSREIGESLMFSGDFFKKRIYPPERYQEKPLAPTSEWYQFGVLLNQIAALARNDQIMKQFLYQFSVLINCLTVLEPEERWRFTEVEIYFKYMLKNFSPNQIAIQFPIIHGERIPIWFHRTTRKNLSQDPKTITHQYKSSQFQCEFFGMNAKTLFFDISKFLPTLNIAAHRPVVYEFRENFPYLLRMPQSNNVMTYFHKFSFLVFHLNFFCYVEIYDKKRKLLHTVATYSYLDVVNKINSCKNCLRVVH